MEIARAGAKLVGVPYGSELYIETYLRQRLAKTQELLTEIAKMGSVQDQLLLLRACAHPRAAYWNRLLPPDYPFKDLFLAQHDNIVLDCLCTVLGVDRLSLTDQQLMQIGWPLHLGGMGLTPQLSLTKVAHCSSVADSAGAIYERLSPLFPSWQANDQRAFRDLPLFTSAKESWTTIREELLQLLPQGSMPFGDSFPIATQESLPQGDSRDHPPKFQATLTQALVHSRYTAILSRDVGIPAAARFTPKEKARIRSAGGPGSSAFLEALPNRYITRLTNEQMRIACGLRLGFHLVPDDLRLCACGKQLDATANHSMMCAKGGGAFRRHHGIQRAFAQIFKEARPRDAISLERLLISLGHVSPADQHRRMDIVVESALKPTLLADTTVIHPVARLSASAKSAGAAAKIREQQKTKVYGDASRSLQMHFTPLAVEAFGRWGARAISLLKRLALEKASEAAAPSLGPASDSDRRPSVNQRVRANLLKRWYRALSCSVQRGNAQILRHNIVTAREVAGRGPRTLGLHNLSDFLV